VGSSIGAIAGLVFVLVNAAAVPWTSVWRVAAVMAAVAIVWFVVVRGPAVDVQPPSRAAIRTYGISVTAMVVLIPVGASVITNVLEKPNAVVVWVVFVVGAHFVPFARAFDLPVFNWLAASLVLVSVVGAVPTLASDSAVAAGWTGVAAGFVVLLFAAVGPRLTRTGAEAPLASA
jgi:dipeptide/tripeptide permease